MRPLLRPALLVFLAALAARLTAQPANVQADPTTGALFRPSAATFISGNNLASATGGIVLGANGGTGVANTGKTLTLGGNVTTSGAFGLTLTLTAASAVTLPTTGTLATLAGSETLTNKTLTSPTLTTPALGAATATSLTLSGNISSSAWTTSGVRLKGVAATLTDTTSTGTVTAAYTDVLGGNTIAASSATTFTDYITAFFKEPTAGSLVTMTNKWALGGESLRVGTSTPMTVSTAGAITANSLTARASTNLTLTSGLVGTNRVNIPDTLSASSSTVGALTIGNGTAAANVAIGGGKVNIGSTEASTGSTSGALQVAGGIYAGAASVFGGTVSVAGSGGASNTLLSNVTGYNAISFNNNVTAGGIVGIYAAAVADNDLFINVPTGRTIHNRVNGTDVFSVNSTAATFAGAVTAGGSVLVTGASKNMRIRDTGITDANYDTLLFQAYDQNVFSIGVGALAGTPSQIRINGATNGVAFTGAVTGITALGWTGGTTATSTGNHVFGTTNTVIMSAGTLTTTGAATFGAVVVKKNYTVATLPAAASWTYGEAYVSDATQAAGTSLGSAPTGGGSVKRGVYSDGSSWLLR